MSTVDLQSEFNGKLQVYEALNDILITVYFHKTVKFENLDIQYSNTAPNFFTIISEAGTYEASQIHSALYYKLYSSNINRL